MCYALRILAAALLVVGFVAATLAADSDDAKQSEFELMVVGPDGKPIPQAQVEFRCTPDLKKDQIRTGTYAQKRSYGVGVKTDDNGILVVQLTQSLKRFE